MADDDTSLPDAYDLVPVDHTPQFSDAPIPKAGQTVPQPNVMGDISSMPGKVASAVGDVTGVSDAYKAATGQMTPEEAQMFALGALPMIAGGPEAKAAQEAAPLMRNLYRGESVYNKGGNFWTTDPEWARQFTQSGLESEVAKKAISEKHIYQPPNEVYAGDPDSVDQAIADARKGGYHAVELSEGQGQPNSLFVFNKRALQPFQEPPPEPPQPQGIRAYHGSPYDFNQFDLSKIGTGEGAQAYGHGLYFAENPATAQDYKSKLSTLANVNDSPEAKTALYYLQQNKFDKPAAIADLQSRLGTKLPDTHPQIQAINNYDPGKMYEVNINADPEHFLDWDKPLSEQSPKVIEGIKATMGSNKYLTKDDIEAFVNSGAMQSTTGREFVNQQIGGGPSATERLRDAGIPGIKYLDQGSRGQTTWTAIHPQGGINDFPNEQQARAFVAKNPEYSLEGPKQTSNYVVFNDKLIDIVKKYGLAGLVAGGASHFSTVPVDHQPDFPDQNGMADGGAVDDATDAPTDPTNSIAPLAAALNQAVPNFDPEAAGFRPSTNIEDVRNKPLWRKAIEVITRKPLPGDLTNYAKGGGVKATKTKANYRGGTANKRCGICSMFQPPRGCSAVRGVISPQALCDFYEPKKAEKKNEVKIDATHDGPWMSCMSIDGATMYRNKNIPATANIKGKTVDVDDMLLHHEVPEREDLEKLIAEFKARFKREPNKNERKAIYLKAHNRSGTPNERAHAKKIGVDWKAWSAWCRGEESKIEKMKFTNQPKDADVKPIPHSHEELEAMDHASAA